MAKAIKFIGWIVLIAGVGIVSVGYVGVAMSDGIWAALQLANPYNVANFLLTVAAIAPGILLIAWGQKLSEKKNGQKSVR